MNTHARFCGVALVVGWMCCGAQAEGPELTVPPAAAQSGLLDSHRKQIDEYAQYWTDALANADSAGRVVDARKNIIGGYNKYGTKAGEYQYAFAEAMADRGKALLARKMPGSADLAALKEINLAISVGRMAQTSLQPLLGTMVAHGNPAVRYFGWNAYSLVRAPALAYGGNSAQAMYDVLAKGLAEESDPQVLSELLMLVRMPQDPDPAEGVTEGAYRLAQEKFLEAFRAHWTRQCQLVMTADPAAAEAAFNGIRAIGSLVAGLGDTADPKPAQQMALNLAYAAGKAFDLADQVAAVAEAIKAAGTATEAGPFAGAGAQDPQAKLKELAERFGVDAGALADLVGRTIHAISASKMLLVECERVLNQLTGKGEPGEQYIGKPLSRRAVSGDLGAAVRLGVLKWVDELKAQGLKDPKDFLEAAPTTAPAAS